MTTDPEPEEPHDHLTRLANEMIEYLRTLPRSEWDRDTDGVAHMLLVLSKWTYPAPMSETPTTPPPVPEPAPEPEPDDPDTA